jgi:hypothetical protein
MTPEDRADALIKELTDGARVGVYSFKLFIDPPSETWILRKILAEALRDAIASGDAAKQASTSVSP